MRQVSLLALLFATSAFALDSKPVLTPVLEEGDEQVAQVNVNDSLSCGDKVVNDHWFNLTVIQKKGSKLKKIYADGKLVETCKDKLKIQKAPVPSTFIDFGLVSKLSDKETLRLFGAGVGSCHFNGQFFIQRFSFSGRDSVNQIFKAYGLEVQEELDEDRESEKVIAKVLRDIHADGLCGRFSEKEISESREHSMRHLAMQDVGFDILVQEGHGEEDFLKFKFSAKRIVKQFQTSLEEFIKNKYSAYDLKQGGFTLEEMKLAGMSLKFFLQSISVNDLKSLYSVAEFKEAGVGAYDLKNAGFAVEDLQKAGFALKALVDAGYDTKKLKSLYPLSDFKSAGWDAYSLKNIGFSAKELRDSGLYTLVDGGYNAQNDLKPLYKIKDFKDAGWDAYSLKNIGYKASEMKDSGLYSLKNLVDGGYNSQNDLKPLYGVKDFVGAGWDVYSMKNIGFTAVEIKASGLFKLKNLVDGGFNAQKDLKPLYTIADFKEAGWDVYSLKNIAYTAPEMKASGLYKLKELVDGGFNAQKELKPLYSIADFKEAGWDVYSLKNIGYSALEMRDSKLYTLKNLIDGGFNVARDLKPLFLVADFRQIGWDAYSLKNLGFGAKEMRAAGFSVRELLDAGFSEQDILG